MVEFRIKVHPKGRMAYVPKRLVETFGTEWRINFNRHAMIIYAKDIKPDLVTKSVELLLAELNLEREISN